MRNVHVRILKFYTAGHSIKKRDVHGHSTVAPVSPEKRKRKEKKKEKGYKQKNEQNQKTSR